MSGAGVRADQHEVDRGGPHHRRAVGVGCLHHGLDDATIRLAQRPARLDDGDPNTERIPRSHRVRPAELVQAGAAQARLRGQVVLHEQAHHEGGGMPAAGDQPAVRARHRGHRIDVERLRIEFLGESNDASLIDADAAALVRGPERVVLEVAEPVIVHPGSIAALVTCELIDHRSITEILQFTCEPRTVAAMLPQTAQTTETEEKPHRSHKVIRKAAESLRPPGQVRGRGTNLGSSVDSTHLHRRPRKIRRTGRHATPSQVEKVAEKAGKAAPAVAIAGALVALPQSAHAEVKTPVKATAVTGQASTVQANTVQAQTTALVKQAAQPRSRTYTV